jgi:quinol monooxygenase YgiN
MPTRLIIKIKNNKMSTVITMLITFNIKPEKFEEFRDALVNDAKNAKKESGNITMELYQNNDKPNILYLFERWVNQEALDKHFEMGYTKDVLRLNDTSLKSPMEILYLDDIEPLEPNKFKKPQESDTPVDLIVVFNVVDGIEKRFIEQFKNSVKNSRPESGNIAFHFHTVKDQRAKFVLYERWRNQAALDFHFQQPYTVELFELFNTALAVPLNDSLNFISEVKY